MRSLECLVGQEFPPWEPDRLPQVEIVVPVLNEERDLAPSVHRLVAGLRIHEVPVDWVDDPDSRVKVAATALADLRGITRMRWGFLRGTLQVPRLCGAAPPRPARPLPRQLARFLAVGVASTLAYVLLYLGLRTALPAL